MLARGPSLRAGGGTVPQIDVMDSTWLAARPRTVAAVVAQPANWRAWWPQLDLVVDEWRGVKGVRWSVRSVRGEHGLAGTAEVWLEQSHDGVVAHFFLRLDPANGETIPRRTRERLERTCRLAAKRAFWSLADDLDPGRSGRLCTTSAR
jgi:hypothetical protein